MGLTRWSVNSWEGVLVNTPLPLCGKGREIAVAGSLKDGIKGGLGKFPEWHGSAVLADVWPP